jgi:hypothetical protein
VYESCVIAEGDYRIVPRNRADKCIGGEGKGIMALGGVGGGGQVWSLKQFEEDEYCIYHGEEQQKKIVRAGDYNCFIKQYEEEGEQKEDGDYRWVIEKRGMGDNGQQLYSIRNVGTRLRMNYDNRADVVLPSKEGYYSNYEQWFK